MNDLLRERNLYLQKQNKFNEYKKAIKKKFRDEGYAFEWELQGTLCNYFEYLGFDEKKRIVEAVISLGNGGECCLRYPSSGDIYTKGMEVTNWNLPITDMGDIIDMDFKLDIHKIQVLITDLNKRKLFNQIALNLFFC